MKKWMLLLLALLMAAGLAACKDQPKPTKLTDAAPLDPVVVAGIFGVDLTGLSSEEALAKLNKSVEAYALELTVNGKTFSVTAEEIQLQVNGDALNAYLDELIAGGQPDTAGILVYNAQDLRAAITRRFDSAARNATIVFTGGKFVLKEEHGGQYIDPRSAMEAAGAAIVKLIPSAAAEGTITKTEPTLLADSQQARDALDRANAYLNISLAYTFTPDTYPTKTETLSKSTIASLIAFDEDLNARPDADAIAGFAARMNQKYKTPGEQGKFTTTGGYTINIQVNYAGQLVDTDKLAQDLTKCIREKISGTRVAPYLPKEASKNTTFDGNYVEVNLSAQYVWVYKNGKLAVSTPIVSGCVFEECTTPTGVYKVQNKAVNTVLYGGGNDGYVSHVAYWVGFIGRSIGLHDASWRDNFGGDIYLYNGSHGCVNVPTGAMASIYNNVSVGTTVVVYGGATNAAPVEQTVTGTQSYRLVLGDAPVQLDAKPQYPVQGICYTSSAPNVVTVSTDGTVTAVAQGSATVTVTVPAAKYYTEATLQVSVTVETPCQAGRHSFTVYSQVNAPTCDTEGLEKAVCDHCDATDQRAIPATGHSYLEAEQYCSHGCGTQNPDYLPPAPEPETPPVQEP